MTLCGWEPYVCLASWLFNSLQGVCVCRLISGSEPFLPGPSGLFWAARTCGRKVALGSGIATAWVDGSILVRRGHRRASGPTFYNTLD